MKMRFFRLERKKEKRKPLKIGSCEEISFFLSIHESTNDLIGCIFKKSALSEKLLSKDNRPKSFAFECVHTSLHTQVRIS